MGGAPIADIARDRRVGSMVEGPAITPVPGRGTTDQGVAVGSGDGPTVSANPSNHPDRAANEAARLYVHQRYGTSPRPTWDLEVFQGASWECGGSGVFSDVGLSRPSCWNAATRIWAQGETVGGHLGGLQVTGRFALRGAHRRSLMTTWASIWLVAARTSRPIYAMRCLRKAKRLGFS